MITIRIRCIFENDFILQWINILHSMRIFVRFFIIVFILICIVKGSFAQVSFVGLYQGNSIITVAEGGKVYVAGTLRTNGVIFNGGEIFVQQNIENINSTGSVYPNSVGSTILNGNAEQHIIGSWKFNELRIDKSSGDVRLREDIVVDSLLKFVQGNLFIDSFTVDLRNKGALSGETNDSRVYALDGIVTTTRHLQGLTKNTDIAGLGFFVEAPLQSFGTTTISRGHTVFPDAGSGSIARYFNVTTTNQLPIKDIKIRYFETDNIRNESLLQMYAYKTTLPVWFPRGGIVNEVLDTIASPYYRTLGSERITLAPASDNATCSHNDPNYVEAIYLVSTHAYTLDTLQFINFSFSNNATASINYIWNFGDGGTVNVEDTSHIYKTPGIYATTLQVSNNFCSDIRRKYDTITVAPPARSIGLVYGEILSSFTYYPNPCSSSLTIDAKFSGEFSSVLSVFDVLGQKIFEKNYVEKSFSDQLPFQEYAAGMYIVELEVMGKRYTYKVIKD